MVHFVPICSNYDFFEETGVGFIRTDEYASKYETPSGLKPVPKPFNLMTMLKDGLRFYPVVYQCESSTVFFNLYFNSSPEDPKKRRWHKVPHRYYGECSLRRKEFDERTQSYYYESYLDQRVATQKWRYYGISLNDLAEMGEMKINGLPHIGSFDFDAIRQFANPHASF